MDYRTIYKNNQTKQVFVFTAEDSGSTRFYRFPVPQGLTPGDYDYFIIRADGELVINENDIRLSTIDGEPVAVLDCGVAQVGKITRNYTTYDITKTYKAYGEQAE